MSILKIKHLLGLEGVSAEDITKILETAVSFKQILERPVKKVPTLRGQTVVNLFFENSTRTRISFELAEKRLSADTVNFSASGSSTSKGETLRDTVRNIEAMKIDTVVIRHSSPGSAEYLTKCLDAKIINAGDGSHEHPTQGLLDIFTLREKFGNLKGKKIAIVGDIAYGRVPLSNIYGLQALGAEIMLCGPPTLIPRDIEKIGVKVSYRIEEAIEFADALNVLRIQLERQNSTGLFPTTREYFRFFGITKERLKSKPEIVILHPGPINRGVEIDSEVADGENSVILEQVTNGVAVRMAVLYLLSGGEEVRENQ
ncbi:aspartate carbamoyltransferase catalytic subunit [bacterium]|nr:aspartate carbamoyltransferase catalytic subunit [bacterium]